MKISPFFTRNIEFWFLGIEACWGEVDVFDIGLCLGWFMVGLKFERDAE